MIKEADKNEIWKNIQGYEGIYMISNLGRVKSLSRFREIGYGRKQPIKEIILKQYIRDGYYTVTLNKNSKGKPFRVHRLIAQEFVPNPQGLECVNHKDENRLNNRIENLEWCTRVYNLNYGSARKRMAEKLRNGALTKKRLTKCILDTTTNKTYKSITIACRELSFPRATMQRWLKKERRFKYVD